MAEQDDDARVQEIRARLEAATPGPWQPWPDGTEESVESVSVGRFVCHLNSNMRQFREDAAFIAHAREDVPYLLARLDALTAERDAIQAAWGYDKGLADDAIDHHMARWKNAEAERDALAARLAATEAALAPCTLALEYRDGVTCREERDKGVCLNHRVIAGLRVHAVTAARLEIENRALRRQVRATYGIIHEGLHGGKPTDPDHQEACEMPSCRNARAALVGSREQTAEGA